MSHSAPPPEGVATPPNCTCDIFDIGPRCDPCVKACSEAGHPYTEHKVNGQNHMCGVILR